MKPTRISHLRNIWEQKQTNFTHQSETTEKGQDRKVLWRMQTKGAFKHSKSENNSTYLRTYAHMFTNFERINMSHG